jgi:excisionase family DNA binding protein
MNEKIMGEVLTLKEACEYLHISRTHMYELMKVKQVRFSDVGLNNSKRHIYRFLKTDLLKFMQKNRMEDLYDYKPADGDA